MRHRRGVAFQGFNAVLLHEGLTLESHLSHVTRHVLKVDGSRWFLQILDLSDRYLGVLCWAAVLINGRCCLLLLSRGSNVTEIVF